MTITMHVCRGNFRSTWISSGGYEPVAETLLGELDIDGYFLEYDTERAGGFEPLRFLPKGRRSSSSASITSKTGTLEKKDDVKRRIDEATKFAALDQLASRRNAASPRPRRATSSPRRRSGRSSARSSRSRTRFGADGRRRRSATRPGGFPDRTPQFEPTAARLGICRRLSLPEEPHQLSMREYVAGKDATSQVAGPRGPRWRYRRRHLRKRPQFGYATGSVRRAADTKA